MKHLQNIRARWAVGNIRTGRESELAMVLAQRGREVYFPIETCWRRRRWNCKSEAVEMAAMPGYLFILDSTIGDTEELYALENFRYFLRTAAGNLHMLSEDDIDWMREKMEKVEKPAAASLRLFDLWQRVRVPEGPFGGMRGVVTGIMKRHVWVGGGDFPKPVLFPTLLLETDVV